MTTTPRNKPSHARMFLVAALAATSLIGVSAATQSSPVSAVGPGQVLRVNVAEAAGGKTVFGQLAVTGVTDAGFVTAYGCDYGIPRNDSGDISKSDLNYDGTVNAVSSNRLIVQADNNGDVCFYTLTSAEMVIDISSVTATGVTPIANQRTDTRTNGNGSAFKQGGMLRVNVHEAVGDHELGGKTVFGQITVTGIADAGFVTAYACEYGIPRDSNGNINKSDLNYDGAVNAVASNRLIVQADSNGDVCFYTLKAAQMIVDISGFTNTGVIAINNQRTDTRTNGHGAVGAGETLRVNVAEAVHGRMVFGQLAVTGITDAGFVTAYGCEYGIPYDDYGNIAKSDLNYDGAVNAVSSNRLIVQADSNGDICFYTLTPAQMIVDISGFAIGGITAIENQRTDTRPTTTAPTPTTYTHFKKTGPMPEGGAIRMSGPDHYRNPQVPGCTLDYYLMTMVEMWVFEPGCTTSTGTVEKWIEMEDGSMQWFTNPLIGLTS